MAEDEGRRCLVIGMKYDRNINRQRGRKMDGRNKVEKKNMMEQKEKKEGEGEWV